MLTDFYRGWMIEIDKAPDGFQSVCCSPQGQQFTDRVLYSHQADAWQAANQMIDKAFACEGLKQVVRDAYETGQLPFEDWQNLRHSLEQSLNVVLVPKR